MNAAPGPSIAELRATVAQSCRALHQLGLVDLLGHVSGRAPGADYILISPRYGLGVPTLNIIGVEDILVVDLEGRVVEGKARGAPHEICDFAGTPPGPGGLGIEGRWQPPAEVRMHTEIYKRRPDVGGIVHTHQRMATAFGIVGREIRPLITSAAEITLRPIPVYGSAELIDTPQRGEALAALLGDASVCHLRGHGVVVAAASVQQATLLAHGLEEQAAMNLLAASLGEATAITQADIERHLRDRQKNPPGGAPLFHFYQSIDPGPRPLPATPPSYGDLKAAAAEDELQRLKHDTALACRILYHFGLVRSLEHASIRIPGSDRFTFSPSLNMGQMRPEQIAAMDLQGNHLEGPVRPPLYIWAFIEIYKARPDVQAIVHTHQRYGRAFALTGRAILPLQRDGAHLLTEEIPIHQSSDLLYDSERGRAFARALGGSAIVHSRGHGTEYVAQTIQAATNWAVLLERQAELNHLAHSLGTPKALPQELAEGTAREGPSPEVWWQYYRTLVA